jgi:hypothetical protein
MIAYTCLRCIEHLGPISILRPWTVIETYLDHHSPSKGLLLYATSFWHIHFRLAENSSRRLSALLHRIIRLALAVDSDYCPSHEPNDSQIINVGMWLCAFHDFGLLGRTYLEMGAEAVAEDWPYTSPLHVAASTSSLNVLMLILSREPDLKIVDGEGMTPLHVAAFHGHTAAAKMLLAAGSNVNGVTPDSGETPLHIAVRGGKEQIVALLLNHGADVNARNVFSEEAMNIALDQGNYTIAKMLADGGVIDSVYSNAEPSVADATRVLQTMSLTGSDAPSTQ